jgi:hypothetical protein
MAQKIIKSNFKQRNYGSPNGELQWISLQQQTHAEVSAEFIVIGRGYWQVKTQQLKCLSSSRIGRQSIGI